MKEPILLDVDGVLADFHGQTEQDLRAAGGPLDEVYRSWQIQDHLPPEWASWCETQWRQKGWCAKLPVYPDARQGVDLLRGHHQVLFVTTPMSDAPHWHHEREQWLIQHFGAAPSDVIFAHDKSKVRGLILVDDKPSNVAGFGVGGVLWARPYNRQALLTNPRMSSWEALSNYARAQARDMRCAPRLLAHAAASLAGVGCEQHLEGGIWQLGSALQKMRIPEAVLAEVDTHLYRQLEVIPVEYQASEEGK